MPMQSPDALWSTYFMKNRIPLIYANADPDALWSTYVMTNRTLFINANADPGCIMVYSHDGK